MDSEKDEKIVKKAFEITKSVALKLHEENKIVLELFEKETDKYSKKG